MEIKKQHVKIAFPKGIEPASFDKKEFPTLDASRHEPSSHEVIAHLKLLKAFSVLKELVISDAHDESKKSKIWNCYLHIAVRKFIIFISALKLAFPESLSKSFNAFMATMLPPLDVLMVWHTFLLRPRSMWDNFKWNGFPKILYFPFPLYEVNQHIDETYVYNPPEQARKQFTLFIENYFIKSNISEQFSYDCYSLFDPELIKLPLLCPNCHQKLGEVPLLNERNRSGFCEQSFQFISPNNCSCGFNVYVDHNELRKRLLYHNACKEGVMPLIHCYYAPEINPKTPPPPSIQELDKNVKNLITQNSSYYKQIALKTFITIMQHQFRVETKPIIRDYILMNMIHTTVPSSTTFVVHEDLVSCLLRQDIFTETINDKDWLSCEYLQSLTEEAIRRYHNLFKLVKTAPHYVVPTFDIEFIWNTHLLSHKHYFNYSRQKLGFVMDFCFEIDGWDFDASIARTSELYKSQFKKEYLICQVGNRGGNKKRRKPSELRDENEQRYDKLCCISQEHRIKRTSFPWDDEAFSLTFKKSWPAAPTQKVAILADAIVEPVEFIYSGKHVVHHPDSTNSSPGSFVTESLFRNETDGLPKKKRRSGSLSNW